MTRRGAAVAALMLLVASSACTRRTDVAVFDFAGHPSAIAVVGDHVWVSDDVNHTIHVLDARTGQESGTPIEVSRNPIALAAGGGSVWVAHASGYVRAIDVRTREVHKRNLHGSLTGIAYATMTGGVWVTDFERSRLIEVDPSRLRSLRKVPIELGAVRVAEGPDGTIWVTNADDTVTEVVDGEVREVHDVGTAPIGLTSDERTVWIANSEDDTVSVLGSSRSATVEAGRAPVAIAAVDGDAWAANEIDGTLTSINRPDRPPIELGTHPRGAVGVEWFGHKEIWVVGSNPDAVVRVQL
jgi:DNA-binding beta-propeller fold protein YncE